MRVLFIGHTRIGDAALSSGLYNHIVARWPQARITVACGPTPAPLFAAAPNLERLLVIAKRRAGLHWWTLWRRVAGRRWDLVVDLRRSAIGHMVRARRRVAAPPAVKTRSKVEELGCVFSLDPPPPPRLWTTAADDAAAEALTPGDRPVLALGPAANWPGKQWRAERFAAAADRLTGADGALPGALVVAFAAEDEAAQAEAALATTPGERRLNLAGRVDLRVAYACLRRADLFVGNDSGLMHMAAAAQTPTLGLFGPSLHARYRPWGPNAAFVRTELDYEKLVGGPGYDHRRTDTLMDSLSVDTVVAAAIALSTRRRQSMR